MESFEAYKYVGIYIALDGNQKAQIHDLIDKCTKLATVFSQLYFNSKDSEQGFSTIYTPLIKCAIPATSITKKQLSVIQQPIVLAALSRLGFNCNMPWAVIHASTWYGRAGILDLYTEQGCGQVSMLISHLWLKQYLHAPLLSLIETYWISSGLLHPTFVDTSPVPYVTSPWVDSVRQFLHQLNSSIIIPNLPNLPLLRQNGKPIMQQPFTHEYPTSTLEMINACRIHLSIAEISNHQGTSVLECVYQGSCNDNDCPSLWTSSISTLLWRSQHRTPLKAWKACKLYVL
jgi:hypothetical protein